MKKQFTVSQVVTVEVDETKFTPEFLTSFRESIYEIETLDEHLVFLAEKYASGRISGYSNEFVEGYGKLRDMGIRFKLVEQYTEEDAQP